MKRAWYEKTGVFEKLGKGDSVFSSIGDVFVFAACVGYNKNRKVENYEENGEIIWDQIIKDPKQASTIAAIAYTETGDEKALIDADKQIDVAEKFAMGGAQIIQNEVLNTPGDLLSNMEAFLIENKPEEETEEKQRTVLDELQSEFN